jgi:FkbM family methyltransferase
MNDLTNVLICNFGLSDTSGSLPLFTSEGKGVDGSRMNEGLASLFSGDLRSKPLDPVRIERLDDVFSDLDLARVDVIKIDTEGAELCVLRGAEDTLRTYRPILILESNAEALRAAGATPGELIDFLVQGHYDLRLLVEGGGTSPLDPQHIPALCDIVAIPRESSSNGNRIPPED